MRHALLLSRGVEAHPDLERFQVAQSATEEG